jgi:lipoprotein-anchoring transpeptidase ErfK/SrfK
VPTTRAAASPEDGSHGALRTVVDRVAVLVVLALVAAGVALVVQPGRGEAAPSEREQRVRLADLPEATTHARLPKAPQDERPHELTDGEVVNPHRMIRVHRAPGGRAFAKVGPQQMGETWLPVIEQRGGWSRVLLPSRPNGATGWIRTAQVERRTSAYLVRVHLGSRRLELFNQGTSIGSWTVAIGKPSTPTPTGRTFLLGSFTDPKQSFSPVILPLGAHSDSLDSYGGGPGTVALHGWPDPDVFGQAVSHGCVRVPGDALDALRQVPLGTLVVVDER